MLFVLQRALQSFLDDDQLFTVDQYFAVCHLWINRQHQVGWQRPWRGRPGEDIDILITFDIIINHFTTNQLLDSLFDFVARQFCQLSTFGVRVLNLPPNNVITL